MEGFNSSEVDKILGLEEKGMGSKALLALGYRNSTTDHLVNSKKVRREKENMFVVI